MSIFAIMSKHYRRIMIIQKKYIYVGVAVVAGIFLFFAGAFWGLNAQLQTDTVQKLFGDSTTVPKNVDFSLLLKAWHTIDEKYVFAEKIGRAHV